MKPLLFILFINMLFIIAGCSSKPTDMKISSKDLRENDPGKYPVEKTEEQWKRDLKSDQYEILRESGTERPFTGKYYKNEKPGIYFSAASGQPLFASDAKYDSGCGWPSFFEPIVEGAVYYRSDHKHGMIRTEIIDSGSGSHLGHVFEDGPPPTGLRYCLNSDAMIFVGAGEEWPKVVREYMNKHASEEEKKAVSEFFDKK